MSGPVTGQSVLVVDDITDTGESLALATAHVRDAGARRVESATCLHITHSKFLPTYYAEEIPREGWVW
ncbi:MAG: phosphoribosyltransferase, partial [Thermoplasmata archaeon]|nr:phosphoribosyltransferase [Thermoplasmata archaeon]